jgi:hypothetical protein
MLMMICHALAGFEDMIDQAVVKKLMASMREEAKWITDK